MGTTYSNTAIYSEDCKAISPGKLAKYAAIEIGARVVGTKATISLLKRASKAV
jgi:hypothetical protein